VPVDVPKPSGNLSSWASAVTEFLHRAFNDPASLGTTPQPVALSSLQQQSTGNIGLERASLPGVLMYNVNTDRPAYSDGTKWDDFVSKTDLDNLPKVEYGSDAVLAAGTTITFDEPFSSAPAVTVTVVDDVSATETYVATIHSVTTDDFVCEVRHVDDVSPTTVSASDAQVNWIAVGPR